MRLTELAPNVNKKKKFLTKRCTTNIGGTINLIIWYYKKLFGLFYLLILQNT